MVLDDVAPLAPRVATCIMLLYGLPLTRVRALTLDDIFLNEHDEVTLRLRNPAVPVPEPFATLLLQLTTTQRQNRHAGGAWNRYTAARHHGFAST